MSGSLISQHYVKLIIVALLVGTCARILTIRQDYRQYPSVPNGYLIHAVTGFIASALGAVAIPALMTRNFIAVTFLTLAVQQFREIRKMERDSLKDLEHAEYTPRGDAYIDGIAKTFESRNYFALLVSLVSAAAIETSRADGWPAIAAAGIAAGGIVFLLLRRFTKGQSIGDIADLSPGEIEVRGAELFVNGVYVSSQLGFRNAQNLMADEGIAFVVRPREPHYAISLDHYGQRQAMLFEAARAVGVKRYHFTRKDYRDGSVIIVLVPIVRSPEAVRQAILHTPLLESLKKNRALVALMKGGADA